MKRKKALIFGVTGQDGPYMCKHLIKKNYVVHGICRRKNFVNLKKLGVYEKINLHLIINSNKSKILKILKKNFDEIYFFGGQSNVNDSFKKEQETYNSQIEPLKIIVNYIKSQKNKRSKFLYAGSSEMFGNAKGKKKIKEQDTKKPTSPYGLSKLIGYEIIKSYRQMYNLPICTAILFNHESPLRAQKYVFKKIIKNVEKISQKKIKKISFGNIKIKRDFGWAPEYMIGCNKILNSNKIDDYIIATGKTISLEKLINLCFKKYNLKWKNYVLIDKKKYRVAEIKENYADTAKIKKNIKWSPSYKYPDIINKLNSKDI